MAVSVGGKRKSSRGRRGVPRYGAMADINMTPFIDVMLVLLIIFMVAAPLLTTRRFGRSAADERGGAQRRPQADRRVAERAGPALSDGPADRRRRSGGEAPVGVAERRRAADLRARLQGRSVRKGGADHGGHDPGRIQEGGAGHRADQSIAGSGFGRAAVILGLGDLERAARGDAGSHPARLRVGAEVRGQPGIDPGRDGLAERSSTRS